MLGALCLCHSTVAALVVLLDQMLMSLATVGRMAYSRYSADDQHQSRCTEGIESASISIA